MANEAKQEYWGTPCHSCGHMIAFAKVRYDSDDKPITPEPKPHPFVEQCPNCGSEGMYSMGKVVPFEGPATLSFRDHPAFLKY